MLPAAGAGIAIAQPADFRARADALLAGRLSGRRAGRDGDRHAARPDDLFGQPRARRCRRAPAADAGTVFRLGSLTKQFTAAIVLQLVQEGRISLDDPVSRFFPDYPRPGGTATVRQLLNHTSGIQSYTGIPGFMARGAPARAHARRR